MSRLRDGVALLAAVALLCQVTAASAAVFSEGGSSGKAKEQQQPIDQEAEMALGEQLKNDYLEYLARAEEQAAQEEAEREEQERAMADEILREAQMEAIMNELARAQEQQQQYYDQPQEEDEKEIDAREAPPAQQQQQQPKPVVDEEKIDVAPEVKQGEQVDESSESQLTDKAPTAQKKGQSEFVSFVDPESSKLTKSVPSMDKRTIEQVRISGANKGGHLLFLAVGCMMVVAMVATISGGIYRYRKNREEPDDQEYAPYAGTGPRSKKPIKGEKGDETLAYKAQLHHYQQAKQKIICGDDNAGIAGESDEETDEIDDENNFSVYECPGLAPTGDIEVHNPNFAVDRP